MKGEGVYYDVMAPIVYHVLACSSVQIKKETFCFFQLIYVIAAQFFDQSEYIKYKF